MNTGKIDLHIHSCFSDGEYCPSEIVEIAKRQGLDTISITDHDTLDGNFKYYEKECDDICFIPGIELSAFSKKGRMHILGYGIDIYNKDLNDTLVNLKNNSVNSVLSVIEQIKRDYKIIFSYDDLKDLINSNHNINRVDIAKLCVKNGYAVNVRDAFDKYLIEAKKRVIGINNKLLPEECICLISDSGGIPTLAHPKSLELSDDELLKCVQRLASAGLKAIEVYHSSHSDEERRYYLDIAKRCNLLVSGGSDYHGPCVKPDIEIGSGKSNNLCINDLSILRQLKK